jgi:hypothetical protein
VFIPEALKYAADTALDQLREAIRTNQGLISFGNTNLNPKYLAPVLSAANLHHRSVRFVRWGKELPAVPLKTLTQRNLRRFLKTGRYIPISTIADCVKYAEEFISKAGSNGSHSAIASVIGFAMDSNGFVHANTSPRGAAVPVATVYTNAWTDTGGIFNIAEGSAADTWKSTDSVDEHKQTDVGVNIPVASAAAAATAVKETVKPTSAVPAAPILLSSVHHVSAGLTEAKNAPKAVAEENPVSNQGEGQQVKMETFVTEKIEIVQHHAILGGLVPEKAAPVASSQSAPTEAKGHSEEKGHVLEVGPVAPPVEKETGTTVAQHPHHDRERVPVMPEPNPYSCIWTCVLNL